MPEILYGKSSILEALRAKRRSFRRIFLQKKSHSRSFAPSHLDLALTELQQFARLYEIPCQEMPPQWFEEKLSQANHQGWAAEVGEFPVTEEKYWQTSLPQSGALTVLALDQIQDPQNVGAILRTAEACGVQGVLVTEQNSAPLTPAVSRASAGALEHLSIIRIKNLVRSLKQLQKQGFWVVGTAVTDSPDKAQSALDFEWPERTILVLGSEGKGMRRLTIETCDFLIHLPLLGRVASLNVAATTAACLYLRQRFLNRI